MSKRNELINKYVKAQQVMGGKFVWNIKQRIYNKPIAEMTDDEIADLLDYLRKIIEKKLDTYRDLDLFSD